MSRTPEVLWTVSKGTARRQSWIKPTVTTHLNWIKSLDISITKYWWIPTHLIDPMLSYLQNSIDSSHTVQYLTNCHRHANIFLDLISAFGIANTELILKHLASFVISNKLLKWIQMYISNRSGHVLFSRIKSAFFKCLTLIRFKRACSAHGDYCSNVKIMKPYTT